MSSLGTAPTFDTATGQQTAQGVFGELEINGSASIATGQVSVTTSATKIVDAREGRNIIVLSSKSAVAFHVGASGVTSSNGLYVAAVAGASVTLDTADAVYAVGAANLTISYIEQF